NTRKFDMAPGGPAAASAAPQTAVPVIAGARAPQTESIQAASPADGIRPPDRGETTSQVLRGAEVPPAAAPRSEPSRDITLRLSEDNKSVEVRLVERSGELRVAVRSPDAQVAESVRAGLSDLVERLDQRGFETEVWRPQPGVTAQRSDAGSNSHPESRDGG